MLVIVDSVANRLIVQDADVCVIDGQQEFTDVAEMILEGDINMVERKVIFLAIGRAEYRVSDALADLGGVPGTCPPRVQILSFLHTKFSKRNRLGSPDPPMRSMPPMGNPGSATVMTSFSGHGQNTWSESRCSGGSRSLPAFLSRFKRDDPCVCYQE